MRDASPRAHEIARRDQDATLLRAETRSNPHACGGSRHVTLTMSLATEARGLGPAGHDLFSRATRRAGELAAADPVHRARLGRRLELAARSRPEIFSCGAPFGHELETAITHGVFPGRGGIRCAVGRLCDAPYRGKSPPRPPRSRALRSSNKLQGAEHSLA